jgi:virulence-associated protein VagC
MDRAKPSGYQRNFASRAKKYSSKKTGNAVMLIPTAHSWDSLLGSLDKFAPDFMPERNQPQQQPREDVFSP